MKAMIFGWCAIICLLANSVYGSINKKKDKCFSDDHADGCSIPFRDIFFPFASVFKNACDIHDICYECVRIKCCPKNF